MKALLTSYNLSHFFISVIMVEEMTFGLIGNFAEQLLGAHHMNEMCIRDRCRDGFAGGADAWQVSLGGCNQ